MAENKIIKARETMSSKERVRCVFSREKPDRVPINYLSNPGVDKRLKEYLGLDANDTQGLFNQLGVDFRGMGAPYTGPALHTSKRNDRIVNGMYGWTYRWIANESGGYWDYCDFPLENADYDEIAGWSLPDPDLYNYESLEYGIRANEDYALHLGNAGLACIINHMGFFRGMEQALVDLITDDEGGMLLVDRFITGQLKVFERELDFIKKYATNHGKKVNDIVDFVWFGEDLGTQHTPLISHDLFLKQILPRQKPFFDLCDIYNLPTLMHTCGSSSWAYNDYISIGLKGADTLQPEAKNMDPQYLKKTFGGRLIFHGCISTGGPMAFGNVQETVENCENILNIMMPNYEYCFSPTHSLQDNTPPENIVAAYNTAHRLGKY